jgi:hypothetical protein
MVSPDEDSRQTQSAVAGTLSKPWWSGVSGLVAVVALVLTLIATGIAIVQFRGQGGVPTAPSSSAPGDASNICSIAGNSISAGGNVTLQCSAPLPRSLASISVALGSVLRALYLGTSETLPQPNTYPGYNSGPYCHRWGEWPTTVPNLYLINPVINLSVDAGTDELTVVKDIEVEIFKRRAMPAPAELAGSATLVDCRVGGGSNPGYVIDVNTVTSSVTIKTDPPEDGVFEFGEPMPMPPATLDSKNLEHNSAILVLSSYTNFLYEGRIEVVAQVNGNEVRVDIGSRERPFMWAIDTTEALEKIGIPVTAWNSNDLKWVFGDAIYNT